MGFNIANLKTDKDKELKGVWVRYSDGLEVNGDPDPDEFELLIASSQSREFRHEMQRKLADRRRAKRGVQADTSRMEPEDTTIVQIELAAERLILDWRHLSDEQGEPVTCNPERAKVELTDSEPLLQFVLAMAEAPRFGLDIEGQIKN